MLTLTIKTDNAAFADDDGTESDEAMRRECARILRDAARKLENGSDHGTLHDVNGNRCGSFSL